MTIRMPESEAEWDAYWEIAVDSSLERALRSRGYRTLQSPGDRVGVSIGELPSDHILTFFRKTYGDEAVAAGVSLLKRLRGDVWRTKEGTELTADQMSVAHAHNLKRWLEKRAKLVLLGAQIESMCSVVDHDGGEHAHDAIEEADRQLQEMEPFDFLRTLSLYQAICTRATETFTRA